MTPRWDIELLQKYQSDQSQIICQKPSSGDSYD